MRPLQTKLLVSLTLFTMLFTACKKDDIPQPGKPLPSPVVNPVPVPNPNPSETSFTIKLKTVITIGSIVYDSIPAVLTLSSWDSSGTEHKKVLNMNAGANSISLLKKHVKFSFRVNQWSLSDELTLTKDEIKEGETYVLGGAKAAKRLIKEEEYLFAAGAYQPSSKSFYTYNADGSLQQIDFYQKKPQSQELKKYNVDKFIYTAGKLDKIQRYDDKGAAVSYTGFSYNAANKIENMEQKGYGQETYAYVEYNGGMQPSINIDYLYNNGQAMSYTMNFVGGNKVKETAMSSTGGSEGGTFGYDLNINPYVHMNWPDIFLSKSSKNNMISQQKGYAGGFPVAEPYKFEYTYDADGYPVELVKSYKSYTTGEHLYKTKTVYTY
ncbi:MAG TPA: hypothetical protein VFQ73_17285 [Flavisolibacter sp.]|nr:hypothetical protein [Flavisolibacter sp.]